MSVTSIHTRKFSLDMIENLNISPTLPTADMSSEPAMRHEINPLKMAKGGWYAFYKMAF